LPTATVITLGCKVNQYDSQHLEEILRRAGYRIVDRDAPAVDVCVINTCAVTGRSQAKSRQLVRAMRRRHPGAVVVMAGCLPQISPDEALRAGAQVVIGTRMREALPALVQRVREGGGPVVQVREDGDWAFEEAGVLRRRGRHRAVIKIQEGCARRCSYCIVPRARGTPRSRDPARILEEVAALTRQGYREVVLTGVQLGAYGQDLRPRTCLADLLVRLDQIPGQWRLRLSSLEPPDVDQATLEALAGCRRACRHLHLPLQSGDDRILALMGRGYDMKGYLDVVEAARALLPGLAITTDIMVGFPTEDEAAFGRTVRAVMSIGFARLHVFPFSPRPGTPAALMEQVPPSVRKRRAEEMRRIDGILRHRFHQSLVGQRLQVLVERRKDGQWVGYSDNYARVSFASPEDLRGQLVLVEITSASPQGVTGRLAQG